jgi:hypothetical protein
MATVHGHRDCGAVDVAGRLRRRFHRPGRALLTGPQTARSRSRTPTPADLPNLASQRAIPVRGDRAGRRGRHRAAAVQRRRRLGRNPSVGVPVFVVTHSVPRDGRARTRRSGSSPTESSRRWRRPRATAGAGWAEVGGPNIAQQCLDLGLLDQVRVDLVPMLLGEDIRFFDNLSTAPAALERPSAIEAPALPISPTRVCTCSGRTGRPRGSRGHHRSKAVMSERHGYRRASPVGSQPRRRQCPR